MEVVITPTADDAARVVADVVVHLVDRAPRRGARPGDRELAARRVPPAHRRAPGREGLLRGLPRRPARRVRRPARRITPRRTAPSSAGSSPITSTSTPDRLHGPDVWADDLPAACARYDRLLAELGGVDLQLLGIGSDGHVGFNEPGSSLRSRTRVKTLTTATRADNARFFASPDEVPRHVVTQGLGTITDARHVAARGHRGAEGRAGRPGRRGAADGDVPGVGAAAPPARHRRGRRGGRGRLAARPTTTARPTPASRRGSSCERRCVSTRSTCRPTDGAGSMRLRLVNAGPSPLADFRLAFTSVVQLTPDDGAPTRLVRRTSGYHELRPPPEFELRPGEVWDARRRSCAGTGPITPTTARPAPS